jgi:hypothetical protein
MKAYRGIEVQLHRIVSSVLEWSNFTAQPFYRGKLPLYPLTRRLGWLQNGFGCFREKENILTQYLLASHPVTMPNVLRRFLFAVPKYLELNKHNSIRGLKPANTRTSNKAEMTSTLRIFQLPTAAKMLTYFGTCVKNCFVILEVSTNPRESLVRKQFETEIKK